MNTDSANIAQMDNGELFRAAVDASFTSMGLLIGEMAALAEPYFPLGVLDAIWLQALVILACGTVGITLAAMNGESSEHARADVTGGDDTPAEAPLSATAEHPGVGGGAGRLGLSLLRNTVSAYFLLTMSVGIASLGSAALTAIGG